MQQVRGLSFFFFDKPRQLKLRMQGWTITSRYKCKTDGADLLILHFPATQTRMQGRPTTSRYKCKTDRKTLPPPENATGAKTRMEGRTITFRYTCKTDTKTLFFIPRNATPRQLKFSIPGRRNYISIQMQDRHEFIWNAKATKTRMQGRATTFRNKCDTDGKTIFLNAPANKIKNARSNNYMWIQMKDI